MSSLELGAFITHHSTSRTQEWPLAHWSADDLTLAALYFHDDLKIAQAQLAVAEAALITAGGSPNPTVSISPEYNFNAANGTSPWIPAVTLDWPIETAGKRDHRIAAARFRADAVRLRLLNTAWQIRREVHASLLAWAGAKARTSLLGEQLDSLNRLIALLEQRVAAGAMAATEVAPYRIQLEKLRLDHNTAARQVVETRSQLARAIGVTATALDQIAIDFKLEPLDLRAVEMSGVRAKALRHRSDVLAGLSDYAATEEDLQLEVARQYPDIHLGTGYQWDQGENKWGLGLTAEIPVINRNEGPIAEALARRDEAASRFTALQAGVVADLESAGAALQTAREQLTGDVALLRSHDLLRQSLASARAAGAVDRVELLVAELDRFGAENIRLDALMAGHEAAIRLDTACQQSLQPMSVFDPGWLAEESTPLVSPDSNRSSAGKPLNHENHQSR